MLISLPPVLCGWKIRISPARLSTRDASEVRILPAYFGALAALTPGMKQRRF